MRAIFIDAQRPIDSRLLDPRSTQQLGGAAISISARLEKPRREMTVKSWDTLLQDQIEQIRNEIHAGRSTGVFFIDGDRWAIIDYPMFVANGNGVQKQFPLPIDNVFPSSCVFYDNGTAKTDTTIVRDPATVTFTSAPVGRITMKCKRKFRAVLTANEDTIFAESQLYRSDEEGVYTMTPLTFTEVEAVNRG